MRLVARPRDGAGRGPLAGPGACRGGHLSSLDWAIVASYLAGTLAVGMWLARRASGGVEEFFVGGRALPWWLAGTSMAATTFSVDTPLYVTGLVARRGIAGNWEWWAFALSHLLLIYLFARLWRRAEVITDVELTELRYGGRPAALLRGARAFLFAVPINCIAIGYVMLAMRKVIEALGLLEGLPPGLPGDPRLWAVIGLSAFVLLYAGVSGLWGVVATDFLQFVLAMGGALIVAAFALDEVGGLGGLREAVVAAGKPETLHVVPRPGSAELPLVTFLSYLGIQWWAFRRSDGGGEFVQRLSACRNERDAQRAAWLFAVLHYVVRAWPWVLAALVALVLFPDLADPELGYPLLMLRYLPAGLLGLVVASFVAAFMSTVSTQINWGASYLVNDLYARFVEPDATPQRLVALGRIASVLIVALAGTAAFYADDIGAVFRFMIILGTGPGAVLILRWFWWRVNAWAELTSMLGGFAFGLLSYVLWGEMEFGVRLQVTAAGAAAVWIPCMFLTRPEPREVLVAFCRRARPPGPGWNRIRREEGLPDGGSLLGALERVLWASFLLFGAMFAVGGTLLVDARMGVLSALVAAAGWLGLRTRTGRRLRTGAPLAVLAIGLLLPSSGCASRGMEFAPRPGGDRVAGPETAERPSRTPAPVRERATGSPDEDPERPPDSLRVHVQYPEPYRRIAVRDSNFLFGSVGTGDAVLEIEGQPVPVAKNGAFLAWLAVPAPVRGDTAYYRLVARRGADVDSLLHPVRLPPSGYRGPPGTVWLDTLVRPDAEERWLLEGEPLPVEIRGAPGLAVRVEARGVHARLAEEPSVEDSVAVYRGAILIPAAGREGVVPETGPVPGGAVPADTLELRIAGARGRDTVRLRRRVPVRWLHPEALPVGVLAEAPDSVHGRAGVVPARPQPHGPYLWSFPPGTRVVVSGRVGDRIRVRLTPHLAAWVAEEDVRLEPGAIAARSRRVGDLRVEPLHDRLVLRVGVEEPVPIRVEEPDDRTLVLVLYGAEGETERVAYGPADPLLESVEWTQLAGPVYRITLRLATPTWGYRIRYERGDAGAYEGERGGSGGVDGDPILRFDIRRPPPIDLEHPLRGRRIAVDPGHPPGGAHGPTGYYEGDANLAVARRLVRLLRREGAEPVWIREDTLPLGLYDRVARAEEAGAEVFVSIHNNALPDGVRPFGREGTGTYYYHPHSRALAAAVQEGMVSNMGLRDLGILWGDFAVVRQAWMPAVLTEGAFMMFPEHETALRTPAFQRRYARGVLEGIRRFLEQRARRTRDRGGPAPRSAPAIRSSRGKIWTWTD